MRVPVDKASKRRLIESEITSKFNEALKTAASDGLPERPGEDLLAHLSHWTPNQQQLAQDSRGPCHQNNPFRKVLEFWADDDECPTKWCIKTTPNLASVRKRLLDETTPVFDKLIRQYSGASSVVNDHDSNSLLLTSNAEYDANLRSKKKRSHPHVSTSSGKRLKPSLAKETSLSTSPVPIAFSEIDTEAFNVHYGDVFDNSDSDSDSERDVVIEEATEALRLDDRQRIEEYYRRTCTNLGQSLLKGIMKAWIKLREPSKQVRHPYNGGPNVSDDPQNPGRDSVPEWWCTQENWKEGTGCRHKEPDHLGKRERLFFSPILLRQTSSSGGDEFNVEGLRDSTKSLDMKAEAFRLLNQLYDVREMEQRFEEGGADGEDIIYVSKVTSLSSKKKKRRMKKKKRRGKKTIKRVDERPMVKPESNHAPTPQKSSELLTPTTAKPTASAAGDPRSPFDLGFNPTSIKVEYESEGPEYASAIQAPLAQHGATYMKEEVFDAVMPGTTANVNGITTHQDQFQGHEEGLNHLDPHDFYSTLKAEDSPMTGAATASYVPLSGPTSQLPIRDGPVPLRRAASVQRYESPSYTQAWPPRTDQYNFMDALPFERFRMPRASFGMPSSGLQIPIDAANNHAHGLPPHIQQPLCASHGCPNGHTHGWRPENEQQEICARNHCHLDPRSHPVVFSRSVGPPQNQENWDTTFDDFLASGNQGFDVTKSFP